MINNVLSRFDHILCVYAYLFFCILFEFGWYFGFVYDKNNIVIGLIMKCILQIFVGSTNINIADYANSQNNLIWLGPAHRAAHEIRK